MEYKMKTKAIITSLKTGRLNGPLAACVLGTAIMLFPGAALKWLIAAIGLCIGVAAIIKLTMAVFIGRLGLGRPGDILGSLLLIAGAVFIASEPEGMSAVVAVSVGGMLAAGGVIGLIKRLQLRNSGIYTGLTLPISGIMLGTAVICCPVFSINAVCTVIGALVLMIGIMTLVLRIKQAVREYEACDYPGVIEGKFVEL